MDAFEATKYRVPQLQALPESKIPPSEGLKKRVERNNRIKKLATDAAVAKQKANRILRHEMKMRIYKYESEYRKAEKGLVESKRNARKEGGFYREDEPKVMFIVRLKGINKLAPKPKKVLQLFRLRQIHNGVFMKVNKATIEMMKYVEPMVTYGYLSVHTIKKLIYKRGFARVGTLGHRQRKRLQTTEIITENLGQYGIHCIEDIVHEIYTCGPNFRQVNNFLWPFKLNTPRKGYVAKRHGFNEPRGGDWGNRENFMNDFVKRML
eukprot:GHVQ01037938.1.p2 GENE.GHVQ01037938.1~~GHVQ01037938.1.p2  ORF type:complete len:265 (+),score=31.01 GHVQ01037938.1:196-990(+)